MVGLTMPRLSKNQKTVVTAAVMGTALVGGIRANYQEHHPSPGAPASANVLRCLGVTATFGNDHTLNLQPKVEGPVPRGTLARYVVIDDGHTAVSVTGPVNAPTHLQGQPERVEVSILPGGDAAQALACPLWKN